MQWGPGCGRRLHRGKQGGQPGGGAAEPFDESKEYYVQQVIVAEMQRQLSALAVSCKGVDLDEKTWEHMEVFVRDFEAKIQAAKEVLHSLCRVRADGRDVPARVLLPGTVRGAGDDPPVGACCLGVGAGAGPPRGRSLRWRG